jgi:hypothetical protein
LWRPAASSPAVNGGVGSYSGLTGQDMDGQPRLDVYDVGADEASVASVLHRPLTALDVGPAWLGGPASFAAADFNRNGIVDGGDLAMWRAGYGMDSGAALGAGDADGDGVVDGGDFLVWQRQLGPAASAGAAAWTAAVPEPDLGGLSAVAAAVIVLSGRRDYSSE